MRYDFAQTERPYPGDAEPDYSIIDLQMHKSVAMYLTFDFAEHVVKVLNEAEVV